MSVNVDEYRIFAGVEEPCGSCGLLENTSNHQMDMLIGGSHQVASNMHYHLYRL